MTNIISLKKLTKKFGRFTAVNNITLDVREGEIFGFLGPNGAGKTTTISMLTTLMQPTSGSATVDGHDLLSNGVHVRSIIGVVPQTFSLFPELTAGENLSYIGKLYGMSRSDIRQRSKDLLKTVALYEQKDRIAGVFSGGMKQRLSLAASIMSEPKILFMDEPTTGLDPQSRIAMRELTKKLNKEGMTIVYTTHDMDEADKICDRITVMDKGEIITSGSSEELKQMLKTQPDIDIVVESPSSDLISELKKLPFVSKVSVDNGLITITVKGQNDTFANLSKFLNRRGERVLEVYYMQPSLEDVFIQLTRKELRD